MATIDSVVTVNVSLQTTAAAQANFGTPLVIGNKQALAPDLVAEYDIATALASMVADGYATTDLEYLAVQALAAQNPRPTKVKVARRQNVVTQALTVTIPDAITGKVYTVTINGTAYSVTGDGTPSTAEIAGALEDLITAAAITDLTATYTSGATFSIAAANGKMFAVSVNNVSIDDSTPDSTIDDDLNSLVEVDNDWYFLINTCQSGPSITTASAWAQSHKKMYGWSSSDADIIASGSSDVLSVTAALGYDYAFGTWSHAPAQFIEAAWIGKMAPTDPGAADWAYKQLDGVAASTLTATQAGRIETKGGNYLRSINSITHTWDGDTVGGEGIDTIRGVDWWAARMQERLYNLFLNNAKVPGTDAGIAMIQSEIEAQNQEAIEAGVFAADPKPVVTMPLQSERSLSDKANRILSGVTVQATLAGSIRTVVINASIGL